MYKTIIIVSILIILIIIVILYLGKNNDEPDNKSDEACNIIKLPLARGNFTFNYTLPYEEKCVASDLNLNTPNFKENNYYLVMIDLLDVDMLPATYKANQKTLVLINDERLAFNTVIIEPHGFFTIDENFHISDSNAIKII